MFPVGVDLIFVTTCSVVTLYLAVLVVPPFDQVLNSEERRPVALVGLGFGDAAVRVVAADGDVEAVLHDLGGCFGEDFDAVGCVWGHDGFGLDGEGCAVGLFVLFGTGCVEADRYSEAEAFEVGGGVDGYVGVLGVDYFCRLGRRV